MFRRKQIINPSNECVEDAKVMSFTEIKNLYFDAVIEKTIRRQYKNMISWSFNGKAPCERDSVKLLSVLINTDDGNTTSMVIDMTRLLDCRARKIDVSNYEDDHTDKVKAFIAEIISAVEKAPEGTKYLTKNAKDFVLSDIEKIISVLTDEGIRVFEEKGMLTVYIPETM